MVKLLCVFLFVAGFMMFFKPYKVWEMEHKWSVEGGRPTEVYIMWLKIRGVLLMVASVILISFLIWG